MVKRSPYDVIIIGSGIAGLCTAYSLVKRGIESILVVEANPTIGGTSTKQSAAMLTRYTGDPILTRMADRSIAAYTPLIADIEQSTGKRVPIFKCGFALIGHDPVARAQVESAHQLLVEAGASPELGTGHDLNELTNELFTFPLDSLVSLSPDEGYVSLDALTDGMTEYLTDRSVEFLTNARVRYVLRSRNRVVGGIALEHENAYCHSLVNAAGISAQYIAQDLGISLPITASKKHLLTIPNVGRNFRGPAVEVQDDGWYFRPASGGMLVGIGKGETVELDLAQENPNSVDLEILHQVPGYLRKWTNISDENLASISIADLSAGFRPINGLASVGENGFLVAPPVIGEDATVPLYVNAAAGGEFGVTLGPITGEIAADAVMDDLAPWQNR